MPRYHVPIYDDSGQVVGHSTVMRDHRPCTVPNCTDDASLLCDFPVTCDGAQVTCDRRICTGHAKQVGPELHFCPVHQRFAETPEGKHLLEGWLQKVAPDEQLCDTSDDASDSGMVEPRPRAVAPTEELSDLFAPTPQQFREPHRSGHGTIAMGEEDLVEIDEWSISFDKSKNPQPRMPEPVGPITFEVELPLAALEGAAAFFDNADADLIHNLLLADDGHRLRDDERQAFKSMEQRLEQDAGRSLSPKQLAWAKRVMAELEQNAADLTLLEEAIGEADERTEAAFQDMVERIGGRGTLSEKQRAWVQRVADGGR
jgi:hypothetical protein